MEFRDYLYRFRLIIASRIILAVWVVFFAWGMLLSVPSLEHLESGIVEATLVVGVCLSLIAAVVVSILASIGAMQGLPQDEVKSVLIRLWIVPFGAAVHYLALTAPKLFPKNPSGEPTRLNRQT
jgi:hypothetical protein